MLGTSAVRGWLALGCLVAWGLPVNAADPVVRSLSVRGLQIGASTTLIIDGDNLAPEPRLLLPFPVEAKIQPGATDKRVTFSIAVKEAIPGYYPLAVVTAGGISESQIITVDRFQHIPAGAMVPQLPVAIHGSVSGSTVSEFRFPGKKGQSVRIEVEAQRLGSKLRPIVHLLNEQRVQLRWGWGTPRWQGDTRIDAVLPADGNYTITLHDLEYAAPNPSYYCLRVGEWQSVDRVFPPLITRGQRPKLEYLPGGSLDSPMNTDAEVIPLPWPNTSNAAGPRPFIRTSAFPERLESEFSSAKPLPTGRLAISGKLLQPGEEDSYTLPVTPGAKMRFEVFAERYGSPLDLALIVRNDKNQEIARAEDGPGTLDPVLDFTVPANVMSLSLVVRDNQQRGSEQSIYRLLIEPDASNRAESQRYLTPINRLAVAPRQSILIPVYRTIATNDPTQIQGERLPAGLKISGPPIPALADGTLVTLERADGSFEPQMIQLRAQSGGRAEAVNIVDHPLEMSQPWWSGDIPLAAVPAYPSAFRIDWPMLPADALLIPGVNLELPVKVDPVADNAIIALKLLTSQRPPVQANGQPNPNAALRVQQAITIPAKQSEAKVILIVPPTLTGPVYDIAIVAEMLTPDRKTVTGLAHTPIRRMPVQPPVRIALKDAGPIEVKLDPKQPRKLAVIGKVERYKGINGEVKLTISGLPAGVSVPAVTIKPDAAEFTLDFTFPPNVPKGEITGTKVLAAIAPDPKQANVLVNSPPLDIVFRIVP